MRMLPSTTHLASNCTRCVPEGMLSEEYFRELIEGRPRQTIAQEAIRAGCTKFERQHYR